jgi:hypothetical protein
MGRTKKRRMKRPAMEMAQARRRGGEVEVEAADEARGIEKADAEAGGEVVERDEREGEEAPEDEGVGDAGQRALADDFGLAEDFPEEIPDALADGEEMEAGVFARLAESCRRLRRSASRRDDPARRAGRAAMPQTGAEVGRRSAEQMHGRPSNPFANLCN